MSAADGKIWGDGAFTLVCSLASNACLLASSLLVVRHFSGVRGESDHYFLLNSVLMLGILLANLGIPTATTKLLAGARRDGGGDRAMLRSTFGLTAMAASASLLAVGSYVLFASGRPLLHRDLPPLCLCILCFAPCKWLAGALQGLGMLKPAAAFEASLELLRFGALLAVLRMGWGSGAIIRGWALAGMVHLGIGAILLRAAMGRLGAAAGNAGAETGSAGGGKAAGFFRPFPSRAVRDQAVLALYLFLPFAGLFGLTQGLTLLLAERGGPGDASRWAVGLQIASLLPLLAGPLGTVLLPHFARGTSIPGENGRVLAAAKPILARAALLLSVSAALLMLSAGPLLRLLFPPLSSPGAAVVRVLAGLYLAESLKFALDPLLIALGYWKPLARLEALRVAAALIAGYWAVGRWSLPGAVAVLGGAILVSSACKWALYLGAHRLRLREGRHALG